MHLHKFVESASQYTLDACEGDQYDRPARIATTMITKIKLLSSLGYMHAMTVFTFQADLIFSVMPGTT